VINRVKIEIGRVSFWKNPSFNRTGASDSHSRLFYVEGREPDGWDRDRDRDPRYRTKILDVDRDRYPDGDRYLDSEGRARYPDGEGRAWYPDGETRVRYPDGETRVRYPECNWVGLRIPSLRLGKVIQ